MLYAGIDMRIAVSAGSANAGLIAKNTLPIPPVEASLGRFSVTRSVITQAKKSALIMNE